MLRHLPRIVAISLAAAAMALPAPANAATGHRSFTCTGTPAEPSTTRTVTGVIGRSGLMRHVTVLDAAGSVLSTRQHPRRVGISRWHVGYVDRDITGAKVPDRYVLSVPPKLPGGGGYFDATLVIEFAAGGNWQISMFDCQVSGGPTQVGNGRTFACTVVPGEPGTNYAISGRLNRHHQPTRVRVVEKALGVDLTRPGTAALIGTVAGSPWHSGYTDWDITQANPEGNSYTLTIPPVIAGTGGYFDAEFIVDFGAGGSLQTSAFDCSVS